MKENGSDSDKEEHKPKKVKQNYTIRDVIKQNYQSLIKDKIPFNPKEKEYIGSYQRAVMDVINEMDEDEQKEAERILEEWNKTRGPSGVQLK